MVAFINLLLYQCGWFACVLGAAWNRPWVGMGIALSLVGVHLALTTDRRGEATLMLAAACCGLVVDTVQLWLGVFTFPHGHLVDWLPPPWMTVLWIQFATTFRYGLRWFRGRYAWGALFALVGAPLAFFAGEQLGAVEFLPPRLLHFAILSLLWSATVPLLIYFADRVASDDRVGPRYRGLAVSSSAER